jgi:hypothetical protein
VNRCTFTDEVWNCKIWWTYLSCPQITSWSPQGMRVLLQCTFPRAEVVLVTIQRENIRTSMKWTRLLQCLTCPMFAVMLWITTSVSLTNRKSSVHLHARYPPPPPPTHTHCTKDVYTPQGSTRCLWTAGFIWIFIFYCESFMYGSGDVTLWMLCAESTATRSRVG